jgi:hypothetical protein
VKETNYHMIAGNMYKLSVDDILRHCILEQEVAGGHYVGKETS